MGRMSIRMMSACLCALLSLSCTVKEVRDSCPCLLILDFSEDEGQAPSPAALMLTDGGQVIWEDVVDVDSVAEEGYSVSVPRTWIHMRLWSGDEGLVSREGLQIPFGSDCPQVYMYDAEVHADGESCVAKVRLRKNHCVLTVVGKDGGTLPFGMEVTGNVSGYDVSGGPCEGKFQCSVGEDGRVVLPRQTDDSLLLHVSGDGTVRTFALGQYLSSSGYDWTSSDLEDVTVTLDYALTEIALTVEGWEGVYVYDMIM